MMNPESGNQIFKLIKALQPFKVWKIDAKNPGPGYLDSGYVNGFEFMMNIMYI